MYPTLYTNIIPAGRPGQAAPFDELQKPSSNAGVATNDPEFNGYHEAREMPPHRMLMLRRFFQDYKQLEGKVVEVDEIRAAAEAYPIIKAALQRYSEQRRKGFDL